MPIIRRCCCLRDLRKASLVCSCWTIIWSSCALGLAANQLQEDTIQNIFKNFELVGVLFTWGSIASAVAVILTSIVLLIGVIKDLWQLMVPWMLTVVLLIVLDVAVLIFNTVVVGFYSFSVVVMLLWIASTTVNVFCELCVISHFQEVRIGRGRTEDYLNASASDGHASVYAAADVSEVLLTNEQWSAASSGSSGLGSPRMANGHSDCLPAYERGGHGAVAGVEMDSSKDKSPSGDEVAGNRTFILATSS